MAGTEYIVRSPDCKLKYFAELYKREIIDNYKYDLPLLEEYNYDLIRLKLIDADYEKKIKNMNDAIKRLKVQLYLCGPKIDQEKKIRKNLNIMKDKLNDYASNIEYLQRPSLESFADSQKNRFLLINTIYKDNNLVFNKDNLNIGLLNRVINLLNEENVSIIKFREIALSDNWRGYWNSNKKNVFGLASKDFSEDQKILTSFSRMFDNIFESPNCPEDEIIRDHDKIDGYLIHEQEKNKDANKKEFTVDIDDRFQEVFVGSQSQEQANKIYASNPQDGLRILKERAQVMKAKGNEPVKDIEFLDNRLSILEQSSDNMGRHIKGIGK